MIDDRIHHPNLEWRLGVLGVLILEALTNRREIVGRELPSLVLAPRPPDCREFKSRQEVPLDLLSTDFVREEHVKVQTAIAPLVSANDKSS